MSGNKNRKKKDEEDSGLGTAVLAGAAVAGVAAIGYGLWKFFQSDENEPKKKDVDTQEQFFRREYDTLQPKLNFSPKTNKDKLLSLYGENMKLVQKFKFPLREMVVEVENCFNKVIEKHSHTKYFQIDLLTKCGWGKEFLFVNNVECFTFLLPFTFKPEFLQLSELSNKSFELSTKNIHLPELRHGNVSPTNMSKYILNNLINNILHNFLMQENITIFFSYISDGSIILKTYCDNIQKEATLIITPSIIKDGVYLIPFENLDSWKPFYLNEESMFLDKFNPSSMAHKIVFCVFVIISLKWKNYFSVLDNDQLKHVLFQLIEEESHEKDWDIDRIFEHFIDFLLKLQTCLDKKVLFNVFNKNYNLFHNMKEEPRKKLLDFLGKIISCKSWSDLLEPVNF